MSILNNGRIPKYVASTAAGLLLFVGAPPTMAQDDESADEGPIEEVIVTASKRDVNLQDSSLAVSVFTGDQLDQRGIRDLTDIVSAIPGIDLSEPTATESIIIIRGMSTNGRGYHRAEIWRQQTNTSYLDDIVLFPGITPLKMVDLARVEVFKGPQGTIFGKSAMAGAARYVSNPPDMDGMSANVTVSGSMLASSDDMSNQIEGFLNLTNEENMAVRVTGYRHYNAGFIDVLGVYDEPDANWERTQGVRVRGLWNLMDNVSLEGTIIDQSTDVGDVGRPQGTWAASTEQSIWNVVIDPMDPDDPKRQFLEPGDTSEKVMSAKVTVDFDTFTLSAIGADMENHSFFVRNVMWECLPDGWCNGVPAGGLTENGIPATLNFTEGPSERGIETFEVRAISSTSEDDKLQWLAGAWLENNNHRRGALAWWDTKDHEFLASLGTGWPGACAEATGWMDGAHIRNRYQYNNSDEKAVYGEVAYKFTDQFVFTGGIRNSRLRTNFYRGARTDPCINPDNPNHGSEPPHTSDWININTYRFNVDYHVSDDIMLFAFAASGYRPGGRNFFSIPNPNPTPGNERIAMTSDYDSDSLWNWEAGVRSEWNEGRLLLNASLYRIDWTDMQQPEFRPGRRGRELTNIGKSRISGFEGMAILALENNLDLTLNLAYKTGEVLEHPYQPRYIGLPMPGSSSDSWQYSILADWRTTLANNIDTELNFTFRQVPPRYGHWTKEHPTDEYTVLDGNATFSRDQWSVSVFARNMLDNRGVTWQTPYYPGWPDIPPGGDWQNQFVAYYAVIRPRSLGVTLSYDM